MAASTVAMLLGRPSVSDVSAPVPQRYCLVTAILGAVRCGAVPLIGVCRVVTLGGSVSWDSRRFGPHAVANLLDRPVVAVGVLEEGELPAIAGIQLLDGRHLDPSLDELGAGRLDVTDHELHAGTRLGSAARGHGRVRWSPSTSIPEASSAP